MVGQFYRTLRNLIWSRLSRAQIDAAGGALASSKIDRGIQFSLSSASIFPGAGAVSGVAKEGLKKLKEKTSHLQETAAGFSSVLAAFLLLSFSKLKYQQRDSREEKSAKREKNNNNQIGLNSASQPKLESINKNPAKPS